jgi:hypothetical protein
MFMMHSISSTVNRLLTALVNGRPCSAQRCSLTHSGREFLIILYVSVLRSCDLEVVTRYELDNFYCSQSGSQKSLSKSDSYFSEH